MLSKQKKNIFTISAISVVVIFFLYCIGIFKRQYTTLIYVESVKDNVAIKPDYKSVNNPIINTPDFYTLNGAVDPVRGTGDSKYRQIGTLSSYINQTHTFPLIAKKNENDSTRWYYYTKVANTPVPIMVNNKICDDITGCDALFSNDTVFIPELGEDFRVALFNTGYY